MTFRLLFVALMLYLASGFQNVQALLISSSLSNVSGNTWQYNYTVTNNSSSLIVEWFAIYFDDLNYDNLVLVSGPDLEWEIILEQPGAFFAGEDGYIDLYAWDPSFALGSGESILNLIVSFDYTGAGAPPGAQAAEVYDPAVFGLVIIDSTSTPATVNQAPVFGVSWLFLLGMLGTISAAKFRVYKF